MSVQDLVAPIERAGKSLSLDGWIDLLEEVIDHLQVSLDAAKEERPEEDG